jgi:exodeoxyribonuclease VII small subunit
MSRTRKTPPPAPDKMSYEDAIEELEEIVERIEQGDIGLEESLDARRRGDALIKRCRAILDTAEQELEQLSAEDERRSGGGGSRKRKEP